MSSMRVDAAIAAGIFVVAAWIGWRYVQLPEVEAGARYYQETFGPAVLVACGRGFSNTQRLAETSPAGAPLTAFLERTSDTFDCRQLPAQVPDDPPTPLQAASRYLLMTAAAVWRIRGVSWHALAPLFAGLYGFVAAAAFLTLRVAMDRVLALALTAVLVTSTAQLDNLPHLRDYSKTPFFVFTALALAVLMSRSRSARAAVAWSAAVGVAIGIGFGVRFDTLMFLVFFVAAVLIAWPGSLSTTLRLRSACAAVAIAAFLITASPILRSFALGNNTWHVVLLGFSEEQDRALGIEPSVYRLGTFYNDSYIAMVVNGYWARTHDGSQPLRLDTPEYSRAAGAYYRELAHTFPADIVVRAWAAVREILKLPFSPQATQLPAGVHDPTVAAFVAQRAQLLRPLEFIAPWVGVGTALILAGRDLRLALLLLSFLCFFGGLTSLQFHIRHVFHLELLTLLLTGLAVNGLIASVRSRLAGLPSAPMRWRPIGATATGLILLVVVPVAALRLVQQVRAEELVLQYNNGALRNNRELPVTTGSGAVRFAADGVLNTAAAGWPVVSSLYLAELGGAQCDFDSVTLRIRYEGGKPDQDFTRSLHVWLPPSPGAARVFFPAYAAASGMARSAFGFAGVELSADDAPCVVRVGRVPGSERYPLILDMQLPEGRQPPRMYQTVAGLEAATSNRPVVRNYMFPVEERFRRSAVAGPMELLGTRPEYLAPIASMESAGRVRVNGRAATASAYIAAWPGGRASTSDRLVAEGDLRAGGATVGLLKDDQWAVQVNVTDPGPFRVVIRPPADGVFAPIVTSLAPGLLRRNTLTIDRIGWIREPNPRAVEHERTHP